MILGSARSKLLPSACFLGPRRLWTAAAYLKTKSPTYPAPFWSRNYARREQRRSASNIPQKSTAKIACTVQSHSHGNKVATIAIHNPDKLNIVSSPLLEELIKTCDGLLHDELLRAVVLTGADTAPGKAAAFIGGADIREMSQMSSYDEARGFITRVHTACAALRNIPVPVIARVDGFCLGAGLEIAASCDLRLATKNSTFGMPEVKIGLPSVVEAAYLPGLIGWGRTRRFLYLAENITADVAEAWGLVEKVVEDRKTLDGAVGEWVDMLVSNGPKCIRSQKRLMQKWEISDMDTAIQAGVEALAEAFEDGGEEPRRLMKAFIERKR